MILEEMKMEDTCSLILKDENGNIKQSLEVKRKIDIIEKILFALIRRSK